MSPSTGACLTVVRLPFQDLILPPHLEFQTLIVSVNRNTTVKEYLGIRVR